MCCPFFRQSRAVDCLRRQRRSSKTEVRVYFILESSSSFYRLKPFTQGTERRQAVYVQTVQNQHFS